MLLALFVAVATIIAQPAEPKSALQVDVDHLVAEARTLQTLWPWQKPIPEIQRVVRHGKAVASLLLELLDDDPDDRDRMIEPHVQQQVALALCRLYRVTSQCGRIYREFRRVLNGLRLSEGTPT